MTASLSSYLDQGAGSAFWFPSARRQPVAAPGFFRAQVINKRWWLVDPHNQPRLSLGICGVRNRPTPGYEIQAATPYTEITLARYGDHEAWARAQARRMQRWGFNTVGAWSSPEMFRQGIPYTINLEVSQYAGVSVPDRHHGEFPDVFADDFRQAAARAAVEWCAPRMDDPFVLGYFSDNELDWEQKYRGSTMFDYFLAKMPAAAGKQALVAQLRQRYQNDIAGLNRAWDADLTSFEDLLQVPVLEPGRDADRQAVDDDKNGFLRMVGRQYFEVCADAIHAADPHHMILGCRFAGRATPAVYEECGKYCDVISYNNYSYDAPVQHMQPVFDATLRPIMITEFSFKAMDSGLPNSRGAGIPVYTQKERADGYERYVTGALNLPYVVGLHWFRHHDQTTLGAGDRAENSNYGVVDIRDEPYCTLVERMRIVNERAAAIAMAVHL